jgi:hypothetical protein
VSPRPDPRFAVALLLLLACENRSPAPQKESERVTVEAAAPREAPAPLPDASAADAAAASPWAFDCADDSAPPKTGKSIGHTSVVFKLELANGKKAAFKPNARKVRGRYRGEVATYRLARALGITNVPPACLRTFDAKAMSAALASNADASRRFGEEAIVEDGHVTGVVIPWIEGLHFWPLEKEPLQSEVRSWLAAGAEIPPAKLELARQASDLVVLDFITGNWDRYSGENVGLDSTGTRVLFIDNDAAFMDGPPKAELARNKARLEETARFSRPLVASIRALDADRLDAALGEEAPGRPLVAKSVVASVAARMKDLLAIIDAKQSDGGETAVFFQAR